MKHFFRFLCACLVLFSLFSCELDPILDINHNVLNFHYQGGETDIMVAVNKEWTVTWDASWCSISSTGGKSAGILTVSAERNTSSSPRSCEMKFTSENLEKVLVLNQGGFNNE